MPIVSNDIKYRLSGGASNADPNASLGGAMSSTEIVSATLHNLFDVVKGDESAAGDTEYRGFYVLNNHGSLALETAVVWIESEAAGGANVEIGLAAEAVGSDMATIANESTAPSGVSFSAPTSKATGLAIGNLPAGSRKGIWVKRIVPASTGAQNGDNAQLRIEGDTAA